MARSLLAPTAFATLLGLAPGCFRAEASPIEAAAPFVAPSVDPVSGAWRMEGEIIEVQAPAMLVASATTRSGNARAPSYDDAMVEMKQPEPGAPEGGLLAAPSGVVLALEAALAAAAGDTAGDTAAGTASDTASDTAAADTAP